MALRHISRVTAPAFRQRPLSCSLLQGVWSSRLAAPPGVPLAPFSALGLPVLRPAHGVRLSSSGSTSNIHGDIDPNSVTSKAMRRKLLEKQALEKQSNAAVVHSEAVPPAPTAPHAFSDPLKVWEAQKAQLYQTVQQQQSSGQEPTFWQNMQQYFVIGFAMALGMLFVRIIFGF